jgi:hypothetical protein
MCIPCRNKNTNEQPGCSAVKKRAGSEGDVRYVPRRPADRPAPAPPVVFFVVGVVAAQAEAAGGARAADREGERRR